VATDLGKAGAPGWGKFAGHAARRWWRGIWYRRGQYGEMACLDAATGQVKWRKDYQKDFAAPCRNGFLRDAAGEGDRVILAVGGKQGDLMALNKQTGAVVWQSKN